MYQWRNLGGGATGGICPSLVFTSTLSAHLPTPPPSLTTIVLCYENPSEKNYEQKKQLKVALV